MTEILVVGMLFLSFVAGGALFSSFAMKGRHR